MNQLKVTRLKLTEEAAAQLDALGISLADLVCVIRFARKTQDSEAQTYHFDIEQVPSGVRAELQHLAGVELRVVSSAIVSATRLAMNETNTRDCLQNAECEIREEKP
jgi:predicted transposase YbfD/YdcC